MLDRSEVAVLRSALDELLDEASRIPLDESGLAGKDALTTSEKFSFTMSATGSTTSGASSTRSRITRRSWTWSTTRRSSTRSRT